MVFFRIAARQKNRENDQHRHCTDVDEHQRKSHKLRAEQKKACIRFGNVAAASAAASVKTAMIMKATPFIVRL